MSEWAETLTERERELRSRFVDEYLVDYIPIAAAIRIGYQESFAEQYARQFLREPYTLQLIAEREQELGVEEEEDRHRKKVIAGLYREAHAMRNTGSARVAALTAIARIVGLEAPVKTKNEHNVRHSTGDELLDKLSVEDLELIKSKLYSDAS